MLAIQEGNLAENAEKPSALVANACVRYQIGVPPLFEAAYSVTARRLCFCVPSKSIISSSHSDKRDSRSNVMAVYTAMKKAVSANGARKSWIDLWPRAFIFAGIIKNREKLGEMPLAGIRIPATKRVVEVSVATRGSALATTKVSTGQKWPAASSLADTVGRRDADIEFKVDQ